MNPSSSFVLLTWIALSFQAEKVKFQLRLGQSKPIYNAFKAIQESPDWHTLSDARKRIVESKLQNIVLLCCSCDMLFYLFCLGMLIFILSCLNCFGWHFNAASQLLFFLYKFILTIVFVPLQTK